MSSTDGANDDESGPVIGSGNFLADMGYEDPDGHRLKIFMADEITTVLAERKLDSQEAATVTGLAEEDVPRLVNGVVDDFSIERLLRVMTSLGKNVHVVWTEAPTAHGSVLVGIPEPLLESLREQSMTEEPDGPEEASGSSP